MKKPYLGIWLDHTQVYGIWLDSDGGTEVEHAQVDPTEAVGKAHRAGSSQAGIYGRLAPHVTADEKRHQKADRLYKRIMRAAHGVEKLYIFGPGQARKELQKALERNKDFQGEIVGVDGADKMTEAQMVAHVKSVFGVNRFGA